MVNLATSAARSSSPTEHGQQGHAVLEPAPERRQSYRRRVGHKGFSQNRLNAVRQLVHVDLNAAGDTVPINRALNGHYTAEEARGGWPNSTASRAEREAIATDMTRTPSTRRSLARRCR